MKKIILLTILFGNYCLTMATEQDKLLEQIKEELAGKCDPKLYTLNNTKLQAACYDKDQKTIYTDIDIYDEKMNLSVNEDGRLVDLKK
jgi:hypothetical protein